MREWNPRDFAQKVESKRTEAGLSRKQLAEASSLTYRTIFNIENQKTQTTSVSTLYALASAFDCDVSELLT